jgi:hypothetical protein
VKGLESSESVLELLRSTSPACSKKAPNCLLIAPRLTSVTPVQERKLVLRRAVFASSIFRYVIRQMAADSQIFHVFDAYTGSPSKTQNSTKSDQIRLNHMIRLYQWQTIYVPSFRDIGHHLRISHLMSVSRGSEADLQIP